MKILITGGSGFIGRALSSSLVEEGHEVFSLDRSLVAEENKLPKVKYIHCDTKDISSIPAEFDVLYHMGEYSRISTSFDDIQSVWDSNIVGTFNVLEYCRNNNIKLVYGASSSKFGNNGEDENLSPYAWTKSKNVELVKNYGSWFGLRYSIAYFYNVYGPGQVSTGKYSTVIGIFEDLCSRGLPLTVVLPGTQRRFFTHISDVVAGLSALLSCGEGQEFSFGDPKSNYSIEEVAKMFTNNIIYVKDKKGDRVGSPLNIENSKQLLGWEPTLNLSDYIRDFKNA